MHTLISRQARERFGLEGDLPGLPDLAAARRLAERLNASRDLVHFPELGVRAGELNGLRVWVEALRLVVRHYLTEAPDLLRRTLETLRQRLGEGPVEKTLERFREEFPPPPTEAPAAPSPSPSSSPSPLSPDEEALEGMLLLWWLRHNPAAEPFRDLLDDSALAEGSDYRRLMQAVAAEWRDLPVPGPFWGPAEEGGAPGRDWPGQLEGLLEPAEPEATGMAFPDRWRHEAQIALGVMREESKPVFHGPPPGPPPEARQGLDLEALAASEARFSDDQEWMLGLVLLAKNVFVWLDQLSAAAGRPVERLDEIPESELDRLAGLGITGLWLIGVWRRSVASERIKQLCGNPEAAASAYSLYDYVIAPELGGEAALATLEARAARRGIHLACDMVPNHFGVDSAWVHEHPERFLSLPESPFPGYTFTGPDLSSDPAVGIYLEDGYYDRRDAAVVFQRVDQATGEARYLYHGNDGTSLPWNDTAQLDYLNPATREAVMETILAVARRFPVIRFDAAMTLARRHVQRLWFPAPGEGGAIPSRAEHGLSQEDFDRLLPEEFWHEVVARVEAEAPGTLLLAEAFWLMEGYFVRSLGMHRVYNSAFMHLLREEENDAFQRQLRELLAVDPAILQRFVNYVTNPDEPSAAEQLGTGDKYFGICTVMITLPGLPMFGHGQFEGFTEKYGMEYRRAYHREVVDPGLVAHHERWIVPLLRRRREFATVEGFTLFTVVHPQSGEALDDVLAFVNGGVLVLYHNRATTVRGRLHLSAPWREAPTSLEEGETGGEDAEPGGGLRRVTLAEALGLPLLPSAGHFCRFRDQVHQLEHLHPCRRLSTTGLEIELGPYGLRVLSDFTVVEATPERPYDRLAESLGDQGVTDVEVAARRPRVAPLHAAVRRLLAPALLHRLLSDAPAGLDEVLDGAEGAVLRAYAVLGSPASSSVPSVRSGLQTVATLWADASAPSSPGGLGPVPPSSVEAGFFHAVLAWVVLRPLGDTAEAARQRFEETLLGEAVAEALMEAGATPEEATRRTAGVRYCLAHPEGLPTVGEEGIAPRLEAALRDDALRQLLGIHRFDGVVWFRQEGFEELVAWLWAAAAVAGGGGDEGLPGALAAAMEPSGYRLDRLLEGLEGLEENAAAVWGGERDDG